MLARITLALSVAGLCGCPPATWDDFSTQLHQRACDRAIACGQLARSERNLCTLPPMVTALLQRSDYDIVTALAAGNLIYVPDSAGRCLDAVSAAPCDDGAAQSRFLLGCNNVLRPGTAVGNVCAATDQCAGGTCVQNGTGCPGLCLGYPSPGAVCKPDNTDPSTVCDPSVEFCDGSIAPDGGVSDGHCQYKKQAGSPCDSDEQCSFGLVCSRAVCADPPSLLEGDPCSGAICGEHIYCAPDGRCARQRTWPQACDSVAGCDRGFGCVGLVLPSVSGGAITPGLCRPWLDVGDACDGTQPLTGCPVSNHCTAGQCTPQQTARVSGFRANCDATLACAPGLVCDTNRCADPRGRGAACVDRTTCLSGLVCGTDHVCDSPGVCFP